MQKPINTTQSNTELVKRKQKSARFTALIVALIAFGVFAFTIYMKSKNP